MPRKSEMPLIQRAEGPRAAKVQCNDSLILCRAATAGVKPADLLSYFENSMRENLHMMASLPTPCFIFMLPGYRFARFSYAFLEREYRIILLCAVCLAQIP